MITTVIYLQQQALSDSLDTYLQQNADYRVVERTGKANVAIQAIMGVSPDLVICENTNQGTALDILASSARFSPRTYFLVCNVTPDTDEFLKLLRAGMNDLLPEGWTEDDIWHALDRFRIRRQAAENASRIEPANALRRVLDKQFFEDTIVTNAGATVLEEAKALLTGSDLKIGQIAEGVGFQDARHFSRIFQQQTGMLPSEYRRTAGGTAHLKKG